jgi:hypothetical protein
MDRVCVSTLRPFCDRGTKISETQFIPSNLNYCLWSLVCWHYGFESRRGHGCLSVVNVVCSYVEVSATNWSLVQRSPTDCGVSCLIQKPQEWGDRCACGDAAPQEINVYISNYFQSSVSYSWPKLHLHWSYPKKEVEIWRFHSCVAEDVSLFGCFAVLLSKKLPTYLCAVCARVSHILVHCKVLADVEETVDY